jgi:hypothetical protein
MRLQSDIPIQRAWDYYSSRSVLAVANVLHSTSCTCSYRVHIVRSYILLVSRAGAGYMQACDMCCAAAAVFAETELQLQQVVWVLLGVKALCGVAAAAVANEAGRGTVLPFVKVRGS